MTLESDLYFSGCACAVCQGRVRVESEDPPGGHLQYALVNAGDRTGAAANGKVNYSIDEAADQIIRGERGWSAAIGQPFTVTYGFRAAAPETMPSDTQGFSRFSAVQINQAELAFQAWSDVANIQFARVGAGDMGEAAYSNNAAILMANYASGSAGASAFANFPGSTRASSTAGDVWINSTFSYNANPKMGNYGSQILVHEIGHAIGMAHPSEYDAEPGGTITYANNASYFEDSRQYSVMSYFSEANTGGAFGGFYSAAPMLDDIAAAQLEYGPNMSARADDTVYGFNSTAGRPWFEAVSSSTKLVFAIWDAGGVDTLDVSGFMQNQLIDLRPGNFSSIGGLTGNVAVAQGVRIEGAKGGSGNDRIIGNDYGDSLFGGPGDDVILAGNGVNFVRGDDGGDTITGGGLFDDINGNKGDDLIHGGLGDDWVVGGQGNDMLYGDLGGDVALGNLGNDTAEGGAGNDVVRGGQGDDIVRGGDGDDYVSGDRGSDTVSGGTGADLFHAFSGAGLDRVLDFSLAEGDRVMLDIGTSYSAYQSGADTVVDMGGEDRMVLVNVQLPALTPGWIFNA